MKHDEFVGRVQHLARLSSRGDAEHAIRVVLETLGERIQGGEAKDLASQLPREIGRHLLQSDFQESFGLDEFLWRVADRLGMEPPEATYAARSVIEVLMEAVSRGEIEDVLAQLPAEYQRIFVGAWGQMPPEDLSNRQYRQIWEEMQEERPIWMIQEGWISPHHAGGQQPGQQPQQGWRGQHVQPQRQRQGLWQGQRREGQYGWGGQQGFQPERPLQSWQPWQGEQGGQFEREPRRWQSQRWQSQRWQGQREQIGGQSREGQSGWGEQRGER